MELSEQPKSHARVHLIYGLSIIVLAVIVALLAHAVISHKDFLDFGVTASGGMVDAPMMLP